jgi:hypothetical protein
MGLQPPSVLLWCIERRYLAVETTPGDCRLKIGQLGLGILGIHSLEMAFCLAFGWAYGHHGSFTFGDLVILVSGTSRRAIWSALSLT